MLSSQTPTLVLKDGQVRIVTGSPGGRTIPNTTLWVVLNLLEFGLEPRAAVDAARTHHQWFPDVLSLEGRDWPKATLDALASMGHHVRTTEHQGNANTIVVTPAAENARPRIRGVADHRRSTTKASGD
jgi:gamma-glutamyltranspeptidase/glutathione hydrolase